MPNPRRRRRWPANDRCPGPLGGRQPLCLALGFRVDVLHRPGRRRDLPAGRRAEGNRRRVRRPARRAVDGLHAGLLLHGHRRRVDGLAGRSHEPARAAADRRRLDLCRRLAGQQRRRARALCRLCDPARLLGQFRHLHAGHEQHPGLVRPPPQHRGFPHLGRPGGLGLRVAADLSLAAAGCRLARDPGDLRCRGRARCSSSAPSTCGPRRSCAAPASARRGPVGPAHAVARAHGAAVGRGLLLLHRHGRPVRAHGGLLRRPGLCCRPRLRGDRR